MIQASPVREARLATVALLGITAIWGFTFVVVKDALGNADAVSLLALRFALASVIACAVCGPAQLRVPGLWKAGGILSLSLTLGYQLQTWGLEHTTPARSAFITGLSVVGVPFCSWALDRKRPTAFAFLGAALAVIGLGLLTGAELGTGVALGDLLTLGCAASYAVHIALIGHYAARFSPIPLVAVQMVPTALLCAAVVPFANTHVTWSWPLVGALLLLAAVANVAGISIQTWAQARTPATRAALFYALEPVFAAALSVGLGREHPGAREWAGGVVLMLAVVLGQWTPRAPSPVVVPE